MEVYEIGEGSKVIVVAYDIFGVVAGGRVKNYCDSLADKGYHVYLPDFYRKTYCDPFKASKEELKDFVLSISLDNIKKDLFELLFPEIEKKEVNSIGIVGFCWGAVPCVVGVNES